VYVTQTYPAMVLYLKGFHLTIETWRGGRDAKGWMVKESDDSSIGSNHSLGSLDDTRAGDHGRNLDKVATYPPEGGGDEDETVASHQIRIKLG
jgi:hypothetical protein